MKHIIFFNQFHNGDCFVGKGYVRDMMEQMPDIEFSYAHNNHADIIRDLGIPHLGLNEIPLMDRMTRVAESTDKETVYINTWVGCWQGTKFPHGEHINFQRLHAIWQEYFAYFKLDWTEDPDYYLPEIDYSCFDVSGADSWLRDHKDQRLVLVCNGSANSGQSGMSDFTHSIGQLAAEFPDINFVCTSPSSLTAANIYYTRDINAGLESDINQISYLSQWSELIIGKNSGPFSYCQNRANLGDSRRTFLNFSKLPTDCPSGGSRYLARCLFTPVTDDVRATELIRQQLLYPNFRGTELLI